MTLAKWQSYSYSDLNDIDDRHADESSGLSFAELVYICGVVAIDSHTGTDHHFCQDMYTCTRVRVWYGINIAHKLNLWCRSRRRLSLSVPPSWQLVWLVYWLEHCAGWPWD
jgi:hypothetical protein